MKRKPKAKPTKPTDIEKMLGMDYEECCKFLKKKYGKIKEPYFLNEKCISPNTRIKRAKEGLYIHHIDEDKAIMLSTKEYAQQNPWAYQQGDRLVYCNLLEHLVLHIKIMEYPNPNRTEEVVGVGGVLNFMIPELNDIYSGIQYELPWKQAVVSQVIDKFEDYKLALIHLMWKFKGIPLHMYLTTLMFNSMNKKWSLENNKQILQMIADLYAQVHYDFVFCKETAYEILDELRRIRKATQLKQESKKGK